jgi:primosomal replication protein N
VERERSPAVNMVRLSARIEEAKPLRYTPAGLPALDVWLAHQSAMEESGTVRQVSAGLRAIAFGAVAERLSAQDTGSEWLFQGFLVSWRRSRQVALHIQDFQPNW